MNSYIKFEIKMKIKLLIIMLVIKCTLSTGIKYPDSFSWGDIGGKNYLTQLKNQHIPQYCGSCWSQAITSSLSDRISIMRGGKFPEINLAPQVLLDCVVENKGCHGGDHQIGFKFIQENYITDETCNPYVAESWYEGDRKCSPLSFCKVCNTFGCKQPNRFQKYTITEYNLLVGMEKMMDEIFKRGPIVCSVWDDPLLKYEGFGVITSDQNQPTNHVISIVGWGVEDNMPYWLIRNSWGEYWGFQGYGKVYRGNNTLNIETHCGYGVPKDTWTNEEGIPHEDNIGMKEKSLVEYEVVSKIDDLFKVVYSWWTSKHKVVPKLSIGGLLSSDSEGSFYIKSPLPEDLISTISIPESYFWGNVNEVNYLSWTVNENLPNICSSSWAQAALSSLADRANILYNKTFPEIAFSVQQMLNCNVGGGSCKGGRLSSVYEYGRKNDLVEFGCQIYLASDSNSTKDCSTIQVCENCKPISSFLGFTSQCFAVDRYPRWRISEYGPVKGITSIKAEVYARGPVTCAIHATQEFQDYTGGIFDQSDQFHTPNHAVSIVGWGINNSIEFWIVRNSWGTTWGEVGYARVKFGALGLGDLGCYWGVPIKLT